MRKPLNWEFLSPFKKEPASRVLRHRLAMTTILAVAPFLGYGRQAYAACAPAAAPLTHLCSGTSSGEGIFFSDANVATAGTPAFVVTTDGVFITGNGNQRFIDNNASTSITNSNYYGRGLSVVSLGDVGETPGAVTIFTNGTISGTAHGIYAYNRSSGDITITANGTVTGVDVDEPFDDNYIANDGIYAQNYGNNLTITTGAGSTVTGEHNGIDARNFGSGDLTITANGDVTGNEFDAIYAQNFGKSLNVTVGAQATVDGAGNGIQAQNYGSEDLDITIDGSVTGQGYDGLHAINYGTNLIITTGAGSLVKGNAPPPDPEDPDAVVDSNGIDARNYGTGYLKITADGEVFGNLNDGIYARNDGTDLTIETGDQSLIRGGGNGIGAYNNGSGDLTIIAKGLVDGYAAPSYNNDGGDGIHASNSEDGGNLIITTDADSDVFGGKDGIDAENFGSGFVAITAEGKVTGKGIDYGGGDGIRAYNSSNGGSDEDGNALIITTGANSVVTGSDDGIQAENLGEGNLTITANGIVTGEDGIGISAINSYGPLYDYETYEQIGFAGGNNLTITTGAASVVTGSFIGISARNFGTGDLLVTANGQVTGNDSDGIYALDGSEGGDVTVITGPGKLVSGADDGIDARNYGEGDLSITVTGAVSGADTDNGDGIEAKNFDEESGNLTIVTGANSNVTGGDDGIDADNNGEGHLKITARGVVTGHGSSGIEASNSEDGDYMSIITEAGSVVTGEGNDGIKADHDGDGNLEITVGGTVTGRGEDSEEEGSGIEATNSEGDETIIEVGAAGLVQGDYAAMNIESEDEQDITITNDGLVRNLSDESDGLAIITSGGATDLTNNANLLGTVTFDLDDGFNDKLTNEGFWNTANGTNEFGLGEDEVNNTGTLIAAVDSTNEETTEFRDIENFSNSGLITMVDGQVGDRLLINPSGGILSTYQGNDGVLAIDAVLGPEDPGDVDRLIIRGDTAGTTGIAVNVVDVTGANFEGIHVVAVDGVTHDGDFVLANGPLNAGFFTWDLRYDDGHNWHELFTSGVGGGAFEFAAGITGAQDLWQQSMNTLMQRQADLKSLLQGTQVTPVADFADPVAPTPVAHITPGFWFKGVGAYIERDDEEDGFVLDREQTVFGGLAGFDFGSENIGSQSDALMFGVFAGYLTSELDFKETNSEWTYEGPSVGVYASYVDSAFHLDATVKVDFLDIDIDPADLGAGSDADTDAVNIGGLIDTGYRFGHQLFIEPQASLSVVHTEIDDVDVFGGTVEFDDETSVSGRLGAKLGVADTGSDATVYTSDVTASVWENFSGDNDVSITDPVFGSFGASDDAGGTYGDVSLGFSMAAPEGWSGFIRGNYLFGEDFEAVSGNAGVRYAF